MVDKSEIIPSFLEVCPSFRERWETRVKSWGSRERGDYNDIGELADHIVDLYEKGETERFSDIFDLVEELVNEGNQEVRDLMTIGLLEDIRNIASHRPFGNSVFLSWLGPTSRQAWFEIEEIWRGKSSLAEVIRWERERGIGLELEPAPTSWTERLLTRLFRRRFGRRRR
jgi:hypothetical protein